ICRVSLFDICNQPFHAKKPAVVLLHLSVVIWYNLCIGNTNNNYCSLVSHQDTIERHRHSRASLKSRVLPSVLPVCSMMEKIDCEQHTYNDRLQCTEPNE